MIVLDLDFSLRTDHDTSAACLISLFHTIVAVNRTAGGEVGRGDEFHEPLDSNLRVIDIRHTGID